MKKVLFFIGCCVSFVFADLTADISVAKKAQDYNKIMSLCSNSTENVCNIQLGLIYKEGLGGVKKDPEKAFKYFKTSADQNYLNGMFYTGLSYDEGFGVEVNKEEAFKYFLTAAKNNIPEAQYNVGLYYEKGFGSTKTNLKEAFYWYTIAADNGDDNAQINLSKMYETGIEGVCKKDLSLRLKYLEMAVKQNNSMALFNMGLLNEQGKINNKVDFKKAFEYYTASANLGNADAMLNLGLFYVQGTYVNMDKIKGYNLWIASAKQGNASAQKNLDILCNKSPWVCK